MSRIGRYSFTETVELHVVNAMGESCPVAEDPEVDVEVECVLHCDDPEDGVYGEEVSATIAGTDIQLSEEAIDHLHLGDRAGELFMDSGVVYPKAGTKVMDEHGAIWTVVGSGMHHEEAHEYTLLQRPVPRLGSLWAAPADPFRRMVVETALVVHAPVGEDGVPMFRHVIEEDEPPAGTLKELRAVYVGKPKGNAP